MQKLNRLQEIRWERNLTTEELAKLCGVSHSTISNLESQNHQPTQLTMVKIAKGLQMPVKEIFNLDYNSLDL